MKGDAAEKPTYLTDKDIINDGLIMIPGVSYIVAVCSNLELEGCVIASDLVYVKRTKFGFLFKLPSGYRTFKAKEILGATRIPTRSWFQKFLSKIFG